MEPSEIVTTVDHYSELLQDVLVPPVVFFEVVVATLVIFFIRYRLLVACNIPKRERKKRKSDRINIFGHICMESLLSFIVSYLIISITHANENNYILNVVFSPAVGLIVAAFVDHKFFIPIEGCSNLMTLGIKKGSAAKQSEPSADHSVIVNIGNQEPEEKKDTSSLCVMRESVRENYAKLSRSIVDDPDFREKIVTAINEIQDIQNDHAEHITDVTEKLELALDILAKLQETERINKKVTIKKMIYDCLDKGFATPQENDHITMYYASYNELGGDPEVTALYEEHYVHLDIHEDRRASGSPASVDKRPPVHNCRYGQYDPRN